MPSAALINPWKSWQKIIFRFFFLFLLQTSCLCWDLIVYFTLAIFRKSSPYQFGDIFHPMLKPLHWFDKHIFHTGYDPKIHDPWPGDSHMGVVFYLTALLFAIVLTACWSIYDKKRTSYNKLFYWFNLYLRYTLALTMFGYGIDKLIPVQMSYPGPVALLTPMGQNNLFNVLWQFMGVSRGFMIFSGACEIIGSFLLFSRRTAVFGYLILCTILCNVVAFNFFYNVPVKLFSSQLLIYTLFLLVPYALKLFQFFFYEQPVALTQNSFLFHTRWKRYVIWVLLIVIPVLIDFCVTVVDYRRYERDQTDAKHHRIYEVGAFIAKDTLPPLLTDTLRWKYFVFDYDKYAVIFDMKDNKDWYECDIDSMKKVFTLHDNPDTTTWHVFHYAYPSKDSLLLTGKWKNRDVTIMMKSTPIDSMPLNKEKIRWLRD
jgi:hypothetical protein